MKPYQSTPPGCAVCLLQITHKVQCFPTLQSAFDSRASQRRETVFVRKIAQRKDCVCVVCAAWRYSAWRRIGYARLRASESFLYVWNRYSEYSSYFSLVPTLFDWVSITVLDPSREKHILEETRSMLLVSQSDGRRRWRASLLPVGSSLPVLHLELRQPTQQISQGRIRHQQFDCPSMPTLMADVWALEVWSTFLRWIIFRGYDHESSGLASKILHVTHHIALKISVASL